MRKTILLYGLALTFLVFLLKFLEYRFLVRDLTIEFYLGLVAILFTSLGIWAGYKITRRKSVLVVPATTNKQINDRSLKEIGISKRELEVLQLMSLGLSNQEVADKLFVSLNTVKTHTSNLFIKLEVKRRTQAIQKAKELGLLGN
jgi:two-component system, NarL family, response regulator LiaR